jgi:phthalate 4,5-cis-dihydrodiol dehydrogenase
MLGVGILGAGFFGAYHARAIASLDDVRLVAACAEERSLAEAFTAAHGGKARRLARNARGQIPRRGLNHCAAPSALSASGGCAASRQACSARKANGTVSVESSSIIAAAEKNSDKLMVGQILHFVWPCLVARQVLDRGDLGKPITRSSSLLKIWMESYCALPTVDLDKLQVWASAMGAALSI